MSEDIDLILDWQLLGASINEPLQERSKRQQEIYNERLNNLAKEFIANELYYDLLNGLSNIYDVNIGILPCVRLEIGPLAAWTPAEVMNINPYISNCIFRIIPARYLGNCRPHQKGEANYAEGYLKADRQDIL